AADFSAVDFCCGHAHITSNTGATKSRNSAENFTDKANPSAAPASAARRQLGALPNQRMAITLPKIVVIAATSTVAKCPCASSGGDNKKSALAMAAANSPNRSRDQR